MEYQMFSDDKGTDNHTAHDYLFHVTDKVIISTIYDLGTMYDTINGGIMNATLWSNRLTKPKDVPKNVFDFLLSIEFIDHTNHSLTQTGKLYFEAMFIHQDKAIADACIKTGLLKNPAINLVGQVFYGRGKISVEQLRVLLNHHCISESEVEYSEVISLLTLLNKYGVVIYDKKNKCFFVKEPTNTDLLVSQYYINPSTPFSNIYNLRRIIRASKGDIFWIDKHFRKEGFEIIIDGLDYDGVNTVTIISGSENCTQSAYSDYFALKSELKERKVDLTWRIVNDSTFKWHDRWLISDKTCFNIPPILAIIRGQRSDIIQTKKTLDVRPFLEASIPVKVD